MTVRPVPIIATASGKDTCSGNRCSDVGLITAWLA